ncbi:MAG: PEP-CTERM sorting domain-containing protein [Pseudomonadota bacterium]|nr:PEP-CTERM sorting domain-containing protein [Pseudomonadota bacterium]
MTIIPRRATLISSVLSALLLGSSGNALASLIFLDAEEFQGTGLGAVNTILTMSSQGATTTESGCVARSTDGSADITGADACGRFPEVSMFTGGDELAINKTETFGDLGIASAAELRIIFNATEPAGNSITLNQLVMGIFTPDGDLVFSATTADPVVFPSSNPGIGNAGFVFGLDAMQAAAAASFITADNRIGLAAMASDATGGPETFFVAPAQQVLPEPASAALLGLGALSLLGFRRRRAVTRNSR